MGDSSNPINRVSTVNTELACGNRFTHVALLVIAAVLALAVLPAAASAESSGFGRVADGIEFSFAPVLNEVTAGTAGFQEVDLRNLAGVGLNVETSSAFASAAGSAAGTGIETGTGFGAPANWISLAENKFVLLAGEKRVLNLAWSIPHDAVPGDYLVTLTADGRRGAVGAAGSGERVASAVHSFLLRVKPAPSPSSSSPFSLSESVNADFEAGKLFVSLKLDNPSNDKTPGISVQDFPARVFANEGNAGSVVFTGGAGTSGAVEEKSSGAVSSGAGFSVKWVLPDGLQAGETRFFSYSIPFNAADFEKIDFAGLREWSAAAVELKASEQPPAVLSVTDLKASKAVAGKAGVVEASVVEAKVFYGGDKTLQATAALEAPGFFTVSPQQTTLALEPKSEKTLFFNVTPSSTTASGAYNLLFTVTSDDATATKTALIVVENPASGEAAGFALVALGTNSNYALALLAILVLLAVFSLFAAGRLKRLRLLRNEEFEDREGFLDQVKRSL